MAGAFKPSSLKPPGVPSRANKRSGPTDPDEDVEPASILTPRKEGKQRAHIVAARPRHAPIQHSSLPVQRLLHSRLCKSGPKAQGMLPPCIQVTLGQYHSNLRMLSSADCNAGPEKGQVKPWQCQVALAITQTAFCVGSVYLKSALRQVDSSDGHVFHPIIYAFLREATAGPIMCAMAWFGSGGRPWSVQVPARVMQAGCNGQAVTVPASRSNACAGTCKSRITCITLPATRPC